MDRENCWEFMKCGREEGGEKAETLGVCPAYTFTRADGFLDGKNGGRGCVYITGTFCGGRVQGTHRDKEKECGSCEFYKNLREVHGSDLRVMRFNRYVSEE